MFDPSMLGSSNPQAGGPQGGPPSTIQIPGQSDQGSDADEPAEKGVQSAIKKWMAAADDPQEHAFAAKLYQQVTQFIAKEHDETQNAMGLNSVQKTIARRNGVQ